MHTFHSPSSIPYTPLQSRTSHCYEKLDICFELRVYMKFEIFKMNKNNSLCLNNYRID